MKISGANHPAASDLNGFLYAFVGADRNGAMVTVLSTFARLGLDPWVEASELAGLPPGAARIRLGILLAGSRDVPKLTYGQEAVARKLVTLLPARAAPQTALQAGSFQGRHGLAAVVTMSAIAIFLIMLAQF